MNAIFHITFMISSQLILWVNMIAVISVKCQTKEIHCSSPLPPPPPKSLSWVWKDKDHLSKP